MKKVFQTKLKSITKVLTLVIVASLATFTGCKSYDEDIDKLNTDMKSLETSLTTKITELNAATVAATDVKIAALTADITALKTRVTALETNGATDAEVTAAIAAAKTDILNKTVSLEALTAYKTEVAAELAALKTKVDAAATQAALTALSTDVNGKIVEVNKTITTLGADVDALEALVAKANTDLAALSGTVGTTVTNLAALKADVNARLATLEGVLTISNGKSAVIDDIKAQLTSQLALINTNKDEIAKTKTELANQKTAIEAAYTAAIVGLKTELLAAIKATGDKATAESAALSEEITELKASIAALVAKDAALEADLKLKALDSSLTALLTSYNAYVASNDKAVADLKTAQEALAASTYTKAEIDAKLAVLDADLKKLGTDLKLEFEVFAVRQLSGLLFVPAWVNDGFNAVEVGYIVDIPKAPAVSVKAMFTQQDVTFRFNPTTADLSGTTWSFINNSAVFNAPGASAAPGDKSDLFAAPAFTNNNDGSGTFKLKVGTWSETTGKTNYFALQANKVIDGKTSSVVSDYVKVTTTPYTAKIRNKKTTVVTTAGVVTAPTEYNTSVPNVNDVNFKDYPIVKGGQVDLTTLVMATATNSLVEKTFEAANFGTLGVDYKFVFSLPEYKGTDHSTNQNSSIFVTLDGSILKANATPAPGDRTPLVKVELKSVVGDKLLAQPQYIKFKITDVPEVPGGVIKMTVPAVTYDYSQLFVDAVAGVSAGDYKQIAVSWESVNTSIYNPLGLTHNQFRVKYPSVTSVKATVNGVNDAAATLVKYPLYTSTLGPDVDTYAMWYNITPAAKFGTTELVYTFETGVVTDAKVEITISYTINKPVLDKAIIPAYQYGNATTVFTQGIKSGTSYAMELNLGEGFGFGSSVLKAKFGVGAGKIDPATQEFIVTDNYVKAGVASYVFSQAVPTQTSIPALLGTSNSTGVKMGMNPANPLNVDKRSYPVNFKTTYPNGEVDNFNYTVIFKNPLTIELESTADFDLFDVKTGAKDEINLSKNYVVKMLGEVVFDKAGVTAKAAEYGLTTATQTYQAINIVPAFDYAFSLVTPIAAWENAGTKLTSPQKVADAVFTYSSTFAIVSRTDVINVNHDPASLAKRK